MRKLLTPHVRAIGRPAGPAQHDAVDPAGVEGTPPALKNDLIRLVGQDQVLQRVINTIPAPANTTVSWIVLPSISEAAALVPGPVAQGAEAAELMLAPALAAAAQAFPGTPQYWRSLDPAATASALGGPLLAVVSET